MSDPPGELFVICGFCFKTCTLGQEMKDAAWFYAEPKQAASHIKDHVAFGMQCILDDPRAC